MKPHVFCLTALILTSSIGIGASPRTQEFDQVLINLQAALEIHYAPTILKQNSNSWSFETEVSRIRSLLRESNQLSVMQFRNSIQMSLARAHDLHFKLGIESTTRSNLPISIRCFQNRKCYVAHIERGLTPGSQIPFGKVQIGDELTHVDNIPVLDAIQEVQPLRNGNNWVADLRVAENSLFDRQGHLGHKVQSGQIQLRFKNPETSESYSEIFEWRHKAEKIDLNPNPRKQQSLFTNPRANNPYLRSSIKGYLPQLGAPLLKTPPNSPFVGYSFKYNDRVIGYLRIPSFSTSNGEALVQEYKRWIGIFESTTSGLIVDVTNNPGGTVSFMHAITSLLIKKSIPAVHFQRRLAADDIRRAFSLIETSDLVKDDASAKMFFGNSLQGYPMSFRLVQSALKSARAQLASWERREFLTEPVALDGIAEVWPMEATEEERRRGQPVNYSKPIMIITDQRTMSAAEFFAAQMKDSGRAKIFGIGSSTAGGGGTVRDISFPNRLGFHHITLTDALAVRSTGEYIEEVGVAPDEVYQESREDLMNGYEKLKEELLKAFLAYLDTKL